MKKAFILLICIVSYLFTPAQSAQSAPVSSEPIFNTSNLPVVSVENAAISEGDNGACYMVILLSLSKRSKDPVKVQYQTMSTLDNEEQGYLQKKGTIVFPANRLLQTIWVQVDCDVHSQPDKTFYVKLSGAVNATPEHVIAIGNIEDEILVPKPAPSAASTHSHTSALSTYLPLKN